MQFISYPNWIQFHRVFVYFKLHVFVSQASIQISPSMYFYFPLYPWIRFEFPSCCISLTFFSRAFSFFLVHTSVCFKMSIKRFVLSLKQKPPWTVLNSSENLSVKPRHWFLHTWLMWFSLKDAERLVFYLLLLSTLFCPFLVSFFKKKEGNFRGSSADAECVFTRTWVTLWFTQKAEKNSDVNVLRRLQNKHRHTNREYLHKTEQMLSHVPTYAHSVSSFLSE